VILSTVNLRLISLIPPDSCVKGKFMSGHIVRSQQVSVSQKPNIVGVSFTALQLLVLRVYRPQPFLPHMPQVQSL
jgi:hypothetical protein